MTRYEARLDLETEIAYTERSAWTLRLVQLALKKMNDEYEERGTPKAERTFRTGDIERMTKELDPAEPKVRLKTLSTVEADQRKSAVGQPFPV